MCLDKVDPTPQETEGVGYKVVEKRRWGYYTGILQGNSQKLHRYRFITDGARGEIQANLTDPYLTGYHVYTLLRGAQEFSCGYDSIVKVKYKEVVATGRQDGSRVVIARKLKLLSSRVKEEG